MAGIGICDYQNCPKSSQCKRFLTKIGELFDFEQICNKNNNYKYFWKEDLEVVKKET
jgi:hypothetical protein